MQYFLFLSLIMVNFDAPTTISDDNGKKQTTTITRRQESYFDSLQNIETATSEEIKKRFPRTTADAVREESGVWIQKSGHGGGAPIIRGQIGNRVLYLLDGVRINNGRLFQGPNQFLNQTDINFIDKIDILKGSGSVQYGSDAIGGVINVVTRTPDIFTQDPSLFYSVRSRFSSIDQGFNNSADITFSYDYMSLLIGASSVDVNDVKGGKGLGRLDPSSWNEGHLFIKNNIKLANDKFMRVSYIDSKRTDIDRYDQSKRNSSGIPRFFSPVEDRSIVKIDYDADNLAGFTRSFNAYSYAHLFDTTFNDTLDSAMKINQTHFKGDQDHYGAGMQFNSGVTKAVNVIYGTDYRYENLDESQRSFITDKNTGAVSLSIPKGQTPDGIFDVFDLYTLTDWQLTESLRLSVGLRFENTHLNSDPKQNDALPGLAVDELNLNKTWRAMTWSTGAVYSISSSVNLTGSISTGFRTPTYADALAVAPLNIGVNVPNPDVKPEKSITYETGVRTSQENWSGKSALFYTRLDDLVISKFNGSFLDLNSNGAIDVGELTLSSVNANDGYVYGIESAAEYRLTKIFTVFGQVTWTIGQDTTNDDPLNFIPPVNGLTGAKVDKIADLFWVELYAIIARAQKRVEPLSKTDALMADDPALKFPNAANPPLRDDFSIPGFTTINLKSGLPFSSYGVLYLSIDNIFNKKYRIAYSRIDSPGRSFNVGVELAF
ncbi:MAG: TonB-dependent receptor [Planctomycetes bacterium]|nr:TonB-dependent receptor [Planctomycetota bacterium]